MGGAPDNEVEDNDDIVERSGVEDVADEIGRGLGLGGLSLLDTEKVLLGFGCGTPSLPVPLTVLAL